MEQTTPYQSYLNIYKSICRYCAFDDKDKIWHCSEGWGIQGNSPCSQHNEFICPIALGYKFCKTESYMEKERER